MPARTNTLVGADACACHRPGYYAACDWPTEGDSVVICESCGNEIPDAHGFCGLCADATDTTENRPMSTWTVTVIDGRDVVTTTHRSQSEAIASFAENYDPQGEFPTTPTGVQAAAQSQGLQITITEHED